jgi:hypothetical protein
MFIETAVLERSLMKATFAICLANMVEEKYGKDRWAAALTRAGFPVNKFFMVSEDVADADVFKLMDAVCKVLNITLQDTADAFGEYWMTTFAPHFYKVHFQGVNNAREFLLRMDHVHEITTKDVPSAHPPRFTYHWKDDRTLLMTYHSARHLMAFFIGLVKGVGKYFHEDLRISMASNNCLEISFPK